MKIYYQTYETRFGKGGLVWREDGVVMASHLPGLPAKPPKDYLEKKSTHPLIKILRLYFDRGTLPHDDVPLDWSSLPTFQQLVLQECRKVAKGKTITYGELAKRIGKPNSSRAVGQVLRKNPFAPFVPCHRVVGNNSIGGFGGKGNVDLKRWMLDQEKHTIN